MSSKTKILPKISIVPQGLFGKEQIKQMQKK